MAVGRHEVFGEGSLASRFTPSASLLTGVVLSCLTLVLVFWGLLQIDLPLARFLRSLHSDSLDRAGELGTRLGSGWVLAGISGALLAAGWLLKRPTFRQAGLDGLIAHGAVALIVQALKHLIGRPRPRMTHSGGFQFGPSWDSGLDSFPSGHAAASFAVAAVLARHFPRAAWLFYGAAGAVVVSRVARGSHFPTDVVVGLCLGLVVGSIMANSIRAWQTSVSRALINLTPYLVSSLGLLWIAVHPPPDERMDLIMVGVGTVVMGVGIAGRLSRRGGTDKANVAIAMGLALATGSLLVIILAGLTILTRWVAGRAEDASSDRRTSATTKDGSVLSEAVLAVGLLLAVIVLQGLKGILPIL
jgi:membrane-associated phospholipid phosphatase